MADLRPGDVITCSCCGARTRATWSNQERPWQEGWPLSLIWTHGPHVRWHVTHLAPSLCSWCFERRQALGDDAAPLYRPAPEALEAELPPAEHAPHAPAHVDDLAAGRVAPQQLTPPTQLGLF